MSVYMEDYNTLRDEFLSVAQSSIDNATLQILKEYYAESIGSIRKLSYISNIGNLINILEKRDIVSNENIEPFLYICNNYLNALQLQTKLIEYNGSVQNTQNHPLRNMYKRDLDGVKNIEKWNDLRKLGDLPNCTREQNIENSTKSNSSTGEGILKNTVLLYVSERLGRSWRDVARSLGLRECDITAIENRYPFDLKEQSYQALQSSFGQCTTRNWKLDLLRSLEKARRRDLKESAEEIILHSKSA